MLISEEFILLLSNPWQASWPQVMCNKLLKWTHKNTKKNPANPSKVMFAWEPVARLLRWCKARPPTSVVHFRLFKSTVISAWEACQLSNGGIWSSNAQIHCVSWTNVWWCSSPYIKCVPYQLAAQAMGDSSTHVKASSILWLQASYGRLEKETWLHNWCSISRCLNTTWKLCWLFVLYIPALALC